MMSGKIYTKVFVHIPKTAGSTISHVLERAFPAREIFSIRSPEYKSHLILAHMDASSLGRIRLVKGHITPGELPEGPNYQLFSFVRDPVRRVVSEYFQIRRDQKIPLHEKVSSMSLVEFVHSDLWVRNQQYYYLLGEKKRAIGKQQICEVPVVDLVDRYKYIGVVERFDESLAVLGVFCGAKDVSYRKRNTTQISVSLEECDEEFLKKENALDNDLYLKCAERHVQVLKEMNSDPDFQRLLSGLENGRSPFGTVVDEIRYFKNRLIWKANGTWH